MRTLAFCALVGLLVLGGCTSARERDCKALLPLADEAGAARKLAVAPPSDAGAGPLRPSLAARPRRVADALRQITPEGPATKPPAAALADAMGRYASALETVDRVIAGLGVRPVPGTLGPEALDGISEPIVPLAERCGFPLPTEAQKALPECIALESAMATCLTPKTDDATVEEQLLGCATAIENVRSSDANVTTAVRRLGEGLRRVEPLSRSIGVPAKQAVRLVSEGAKAAGELTAARRDAERADADLRAVCRPKP